MTSDVPSRPASLQGSSLAFVRPMPKRDGGSLSGGSFDGDSSFEIAAIDAGARSAAELWCQLQPDSTGDERQPTAVVSCQLGHFRVEEQIGRGGMGAVFRAVDTRLDRVVALKVLSPSQSHDQGSIERFRNEARAAARMDHDNIARVFYVGEDQGLSFIAFEFVHGANVRELIDHRGVLKPEDSVNYALQVAYALRHTDAAGVVHRDIKPSNIIITPAGRAKLVDLGLARKRDPEASNDLTVDGTTLGTFDYISPEQAKDPKAVDVRSDIYSLGCTLFHMLTGEPPYPKGTMLQKLLDHQAKDIPDASERNPRVPSELSAVVRKMMAADPNDRHASPDRLIDDLKLIAYRYGLRPASTDAELWVSPRSPDGWELWKQYGGWIVTAALLLVVVFIIDYAQRVPTKDLLPPTVKLVNEDTGVFNPEGTIPEITSPRRISPEDDLVTSPPTNPLTPEASIAVPQTPPRGYEGPMPVGTQDLRITDNEQPLFSEPSPTIDDDALSPLTETFPPSFGGIPGVNEPEDQRDISDAEDVEHNPVVSDNEAIPSRLLAPEPDEPFVVLVNGVVRESYPTLEAACSEAPNDASIELAFTGDEIAVQSPLRIIGKHLRIRPALGMRPTLRFAAPAEWRLGRRSDAVSMIEVSKGSLEIYNIDLRLEIDPELNVQQWTAISLANAKELVLQGVSITVENTSHRSVAVIELAEPAGLGFSESPPPAVQIDAEDCFFRGTGDFILDRNVEPAAIRLSNVAIAIDGTLIRIEGTDQHPVAADMNAEHVVEMELKHVTALMSEGFAAFDVQSNFSVPKLVVDAGDSVIVIASSGPLISMRGALGLRDYEDRLEWSDHATFLHGQDLSRSDPVWQISSPGRTRNYDRDEFDTRWNRRSQPLRSATIDLLRWRTGLPYASMSQRDLKLDTDAESPNPARHGANDGSDAGVDWDASRLPQLKSDSNKFPDLD